MLQPYQSTRTLRSNELQLLHVPHARCGYGDRSFAVAAPRLWNSIPLVIKSCTNTPIFKNRIKKLICSQKHLINRHYYVMNIFLALNLAIIVRRL